MKASDLRKSGRVHALIYSASGVGKTHLIGEFAKAGPVWVNDTDFGIETLAGMDNVTYEQWFERVGPTTGGQGWTPQWKKLIDFIDTQLVEPEYKTYAFDSLTTHCDVAAASVVGRVNPRMEIMQLQHYPAVYGKLTDFIVKLRKLDANVILTAHEETTRDARGRRVLQPLVLGEKFGPRLPIFWNNIWHLGLELSDSDRVAAKRVLRVNPDGEKIIKTQGPADVATIEPTYEAIIAHLEAGGRPTGGKHE